MFEIDRELFRVINSLSGHNNWIDGLVTVVASDYLVPVFTGLILFYLWLTSVKSKNIRYGKNNVILCLCTMFVASSAVFLCNLFYFRERPFTLSEVNLLFYMPTDSSFPSNAAAGLAGLSLPIMFVSKRLFLLALSGCILMCFARIYVGIHYPLDILGGFLISLVSLSICVKMLGPLQPLIDMLIDLLEKLKLT